MDLARPKSSSSRGRFWLVVLGPVFILLTLGITLGLWDKMLREEHLQQRREIELLAHNLADRIDAGLAERLNALERMAHRWEIAGGTRQEIWEADALAYQGDLPGFQAVEWADSAGVVRWLVPQAGNANARGLNLMDNPVRRAFLTEAQAQPRIAISPVLNLAQDGKGFIAARPLRVEKKLQGYLLAVFRVETLFAQLTVLELPESMGMGVLYQGNVAYQRGDRASGTGAVNQPLGFAPGWGIQVWQDTAAFEDSLSILPRVMLFSGLAVTMLLTGVLWFWHLALARADENSRLAQIVARTTNGVILADAQGRVEWVNEGFTRISGYTLDDMRGKKPGHVLQGQATDPETVERIHEQLVHGNGFREELLNYRRDGTPYWVDVEVQPMIAADGGLDGFMGIETDITQRKNFELAISESEHRFRDMLRTCPTAARIARDGGHDVVFFNSRYAELINCPLDSVRGIDPSTYYAHVEDYEDVVARLKKGEVVFEKLIELAIPGVGIKWVMASYFPIEWEGAPAILGWFHDITARKQAEDEKNDQLHFLEQLLEVIPVPVYFKDVRGRYLGLNRAFEEFFCVRRADMIGKTVMDLYDKNQELAYFHLEKDAQLLMGGDVQTFEVRLTTPQGLRDTVYHKAVFRREDGQVDGLIGLVRDVTESKKVERMKSEFVSTVSHELRTPLTSIRGALGLVTSGVTGDLAAKTKELLDIALANSERLSCLINDILDIEKIESGKMKFDVAVHDMAVLVQQAIVANQGYAQSRGARLEMGRNDQAVHATVDAGRFAQVMANLISNAVKFSPPGGTVRVTVEKRNEQVRVSVHDQGEGIPESFRDRIFQKFSQADSSDTRAKGGTGLGLAITKSIVEGMGGVIGYDSQPGAGTVFNVEFPLSEAV